MKGVHPESESVFADYYRSAASSVCIDKQPGASGDEGFFRFGDAIAYGTLAGTRTARRAADPLPDVLDTVTVADERLRLPFDLCDVATNLRQERYLSSRRSGVGEAGSASIHRLYYLLRPFMGIGVRKHLQKLRLSGWDRIAFPRWPVDASVDILMASVMELLLKATNASRIPFIWFWPDEAPACVMMTHDVEGRRGLDFCDTLMDLDDAYGIKSAFQLIPEGHEDTWRRTAPRLRARGFEVNLHDLNHDGLLFANKQEFLRRARMINAYARMFECNGFRSAAMYREQGWFDALELPYDMSVPTTARLEPQRGGCCTVMPYFIGDTLELPLTTVQDYTLFHILNDYSIELWRTQIGEIRRRHGLISIITHPDYLVGARERSVYNDLLRHLDTLRRRDGLWFALPGEINRWWRNRLLMRLAPTRDGWRIDGPDSERATVAYASLENDRLVYTLDTPAPLSVGRSAGAATPFRAVITTLN